MNKEQKNNNIFSSERKTAILRILLIFAWLIFIVFCFVNRDKITIDDIVSITPHNTVLAIILMLIIYAIKSLTVVIYCGMIYITCGILFPLPIAVAVNFAGTAIMVTIPFFVGKKAGKDAVNRITNKYPKTAEIRAFETSNDFFLAFIVRIIGLLPSDPISAYMGAVGLDYKKYILGTLLGMLPSIIAFPIIGMSLTDPASPAFIGAVLFEISTSVISVAVFSAVKKRKQKRCHNESKDKHTCNS